MTIIFYIFILLSIVAIFVRTFSLTSYSKLAPKLRWYLNHGSLYLWGFSGFIFLSYLFFEGKEPLSFLFITMYWLLGYFSVWLVPSYIIQFLIENDLLHKKSDTNNETQ